MQDSLGPSHDPWDLSPTWKGSPPGASLHYPPPCSQLSWKVSRLKNLPFSEIHQDSSSIYPYSSSSHPAQKTPLAWQDCPGIPRFRSTQTSFKSPWQVLSEVVNLQMLQELVDMVGALGQVDHKSFACGFSLEPRFPRLLGKSAEKVKF